MHLENTDPQPFISGNSRSQVIAGKHRSAFILKHQIHSSIIILIIIIIIIIIITINIINIIIVVLVPVVVNLFVSTIHRYVYNVVYNQHTLMPRESDS